MKHCRRRPSSVSAAAAAHVSAMEPRVLLHSFTLGDDHILRLTLTDAPENITVTLENGRIRAVLKENGASHDDQSWKASDVNQINISLNGGDDYCKVSQDITKPCLIGGFAGNDTIYGGGGNDQIGGTDGDDFIDGGKGADTITGGNGYDVVSYETRTKAVYTSQALGKDGEQGEGDFIQGDVDEIRGGKGNDVLSGNSYSPTVGTKLVGGAGNDTIKGGAKNDVLEGGAGNDRIDGGKGNDTIIGNAGADRLVGGDGRDSIDGGSGKDSIYGGSGIDTLYGGADRDSFYIADGYGDKVIGGSGNDVVKDKKDKNDVLESVA